MPKISALVSRNNNMEIINDWKTLLIFEYVSKLDVNHVYYNNSGTSKQECLAALCRATSVLFH